MLYIRPTSPIAPTVAIKPIGSSEPVQEQHLTPNKATATPFYPAPNTERRKRRDRRNEAKKTILETRANKDRRKANKPSISITI